MQKQLHNFQEITRKFTNLTANRSINEAKINKIRLMLNKDELEIYGSDLEGEKFLKDAFQKSVEFLVEREDAQSWRRR